MKLSIFFICVFLILLIASELVARFVMGLGAPPLSIAHPTIEYMFKPNQRVSRFGRTQIYNEYGMRSDTLPKLSEKRIVLVIGDSVINGGSLTDQTGLATTIATKNSDNLFFANISAGSWGPSNQLAYLENFGTFGAQVAILVLNSADLTDLPQFEPIDTATHPLQTPRTALGEALTRYLPRFLPKGLAPLLLPSVVPHPYSSPGSRHTAGSGYLNELLNYLSEAHIPSCVIFHHGLDEYSDPKNRGLAALMKVSSSFEVPVIETMELFRRGGQDPKQFFRDNIHINEEGQLELAGGLAGCFAAARVPNGL